jgi:alkylation response protein AidB-like acyl-CoA dehydrogenase
MPDSFRSHVRTWCAENVPPEWEQRLRGASESTYVEFQQEWLQTLGKAGFAAPHWPAEWGGGLGVEKSLVLFEELARARAPRLTLPSIGLHHAAATLLAAGTPEQRARHLPAILDGEIWCQLFSEPGAGSDLASLSTRAVRDGDHYVVTGQKIWSSYAHFADYGLLLARTGRKEDRARGISFFILDMRSPGVDARSIRQSTGDAEFSEVFLEEVRIPVENRLGAEGEGWRTAQVTLGEERGLQVVELAERLHFRILDLLAEVAEQKGDREVDAAAREFARLLEREATLRAMCRALARDPLRPDVEVDISVVKILYGELGKDVFRLATELLGRSALVHQDAFTGGSGETGTWFGDYVASWTWTIAGGTNEIHRDILARRGLNMRRTA